MNDEPKTGAEKTPDLLGAKFGPGTGGDPRRNTGSDDFPGDFAQLKLLVIRPAFENIGATLKERGHEINISEEPGGEIAIHIVPTGLNKSIHPYDWFPTFSVFSAPFTKSIGVHVRNARPNSEGAARGEYKLAQVNRELVEKALMKFVGEIGNWK